MRSVHLLLLSALLVSVSTRAAAQDEPESRDPTNRRLEELEKKVAAQGEELRRLRAAPPVDEKGGVAAATSRTPGALDVAWRFDEGLVVEGRLHDTRFKLRPRGGLQLDYRAYPHEKASDQFVLRRAKVGFDGSFGDFNFDFEVQPLRATIPFVDAWFEWAPVNELKVRFGHFKTPFSLDNGVTLDFRTDFVERPMVIGSGNGVAPDYHPGAEILGSIRDGAVSYWLSVQNIPDSATVATGDPLVAARLETALGAFTVGGAGYWERLAPTVTTTASGPTTVFPSSLAGFTPGQFQFFKPVNVHGWTQAYELDACFYTGPLWVRSEFVWAAQERKRVLADNGDGTPLITQGAYGTVGFVFWGLPADAPRPQAVPFRDWELFSWSIEKKKNKRFVGAELVCRFEWIAIDDARDGRKGQAGVPAVPSLAVNADKVRGNQATAVWVGLNVSPIENVIFMADYVHVRVGDQARAESPHRRQSDELLFRAQLDF